MGEIELTAEQITDLKTWKKYLETDQARTWISEEQEAMDHLQALLHDKAFEKGTDLTPPQLDDLFGYVRTISANRALSNLLYRTIGVEKFNSLLRELYFGKTPFVERVDDFLSQKGIGPQTISQFLVAFDSKEYPFFTGPTKDMLNLDATQEEEARSEALQRYRISDPETYNSQTIQLLSDMVVFEAVRDALGLEQYNQVNVLLWLASKDRDEEADEPFYSVSLEKDLRDYLAANPSTVEKGLILIGKEFDTKTAGRIDLLCKDGGGRHVVVELKKGRKADSVVGQVLRYMGWVSQNKNPKVRGIVIVNERDPYLDYAVAPLGDRLKVRYYRVRFEVTDRPDEENSS